MWRLLRTFPCPHAAQKVTKPQDVRAGGRGIFRFLNSLPTPNSLVQIGKLRPSRQDLPKVTLCQPQGPGESSPSDPGSWSAPQSGPAEAGPATRLTGQKCLGRSERQSRDTREGSPTPGARQLTPTGPDRQDRPMRSRGRRGRVLPLRGKEAEPARRVRQVIAGCSLELPDPGKGPGASGVGGGTFGLGRQRH